MHDNLRQTAQKELTPSSQYLDDLKDFSSSVTPKTSSDSERIQFISGFHDIFLSIGILLLSAAFVLLKNSVQASVGGDIRYTCFLLGMIFVLCGLSEFFTRRQYFALSSFILSLCFALAVGIFSYHLFGLSIDPFGLSPLGTRPFLLALALLVTSAAIYSHYYRYRVSIDISLIAACFIIYIFLLSNELVFSLQGERIYSYLLMGTTGIATLFVALYFDGRDPTRRTRNADIAFWLHLLAAQLIVHYFFLASGLVRGFELKTVYYSTSYRVAFLGVALLVILFSLTAIIIDRRAMIIASLFYCGYPIFLILDTVTQFSADISFGITFLFLGFGVVVLGTGWRPIRGVLLNIIPQKIKYRLPPA